MCTSWRDSVSYTYVTVSSYNHSLAAISKNLNYIFLDTCPQPTASKPVMSLNEWYESYHFTYLLIFLAFAGLRGKSALV